MSPPAGMNSSLKSCIKVLEATYYARIIRSKDQEGHGNMATQETQGTSHLFPSKEVFWHFFKQMVQCYHLKYHLF